MLNPSFIESCFGENFIGIRGYCNDQSDSGYFINDEVNITQKGLAKIASSDDVKLVDFVKRLLRNAVRDTCNDFLDYMNTHGKYITKSITNSREVKSDLNKQLKVKEVGRYMAVRLDYVHVPQDVTLYIDYDGTRETIALTSGVNSIHEIYIADSINFHFYSGNTIIDLIDIPDKTVYFTTELEDEEGITGLSGEVTFRLSSMCSFEKLLCDNKQLLARPIFYHAVGLFFKDKWQSDKIDPFISNTKEESEDLYREYLYGFEDKTSKYHDALVFAVRGLKQNLKNNYCFTCTGFQVQSLI